MYRKFWFKIYFFNQNFLLKNKQKVTQAVCSNGLEFHLHQKVEEFIKS